MDCVVKACDDVLLNNIISVKNKNTQPSPGIPLHIDRNIIAYCVSSSSSFYSCTNHYIIKKKTS